MKVILDLCSHSLKFQKISACRLDFLDNISSFILVDWNNGNGKQKKTQFYQLLNMTRVSWSMWFSCLENIGTLALITILLSILFIVISIGVRTMIHNGNQIFLTEKCVYQIFLEGLNELKWESSPRILGKYLHELNQIPVYPSQGLPWGLSGKDCLQCRRLPACRKHTFDPWDGKIPWRRKWQPTPVFLLENSMGRGAWQLLSMGSQESDMT